jgi:hypothetical protein
MNHSLLLFFFTQIFSKFMDLVGTTIAPEIEKYLVLITSERSQIIDMKAHTL